MPGRSMGSYALDVSESTLKANKWFCFTHAINLFRSDIASTFLRGSYETN